jgi:hypothetical protein
MRLVVVGVLTIGFVTLVLLGLVSMVRELFYESMLDAPSLTDQEATTENSSQSYSRERVRGSA